ncbi:hypothetical protein HMPREF2726_07630 [Neisseria sp. HMSC074B07]|nr:hypothetical protein HMPREF2726_07630 [Neisseria sp. HMSC074B07]
MGKIRRYWGREIAENLCLGFVCRGKGFFAKVSAHKKTAPCELEGMCPTFGVQFKRGGRFSDDLFEWGGGLVVRFKILGIRIFYADVAGFQLSRAKSR